MSHGKKREEKDCLNCGHLVEERFCPHCGQENIVTRQPFHYLFTHFVEDFTHYDGQFWGTLKNLLFNPGKLTKTYLEGKRQKFAPPVKLYIFVSFITFFLFAIFQPIKIDYKPNEDFKKYDKVTSSAQKDVFEKTIKQLEAQKAVNNNPQVIKQIDSLQKILADKDQLEAFEEKNIGQTLDLNSGISYDVNIGGYKTVEEYDRGRKNQNFLIKFIEAPFAHKLFELKEAGMPKREILKKLGETTYHNLPKALFIYLPFFAFLLWIFHNKKKWWYFDHGIFTLHYFCFLLINFLIIGCISAAKNYFSDYSIVTIPLLIINVTLYIYGFLYFFIAHRSVYQTKGIVSLFLGFIIFILNFIALSFLVIFLGIISFIMIH